MFAAYSSSPAWGTSPVRGDCARTRTGRVPHEQRGDSDENKRKQPRHDTDVFVEAGKERSGVSQRYRSAYTGESDASFQERIQKNRPNDTISPPAEPRTAKSESRKKRADRGCDGIDINSDNDRELLDP